MSEISLLGVASVALLSSFSHCAGMCGGFASLCGLASCSLKTSIQGNTTAKKLSSEIDFSKGQNFTQQSESSHEKDVFLLDKVKFTNEQNAKIDSPKSQAEISDSSKIVALINVLIYHLSRTAVYMTLGAVFGAFGGVLVFSKNSRAMLFFVVGIALVFIAVALFRRGTMLQMIESARFGKILTAKMMRVANSSSSLKFSIFGALNGLFPCGVVYYFLALSITSKSAFWGAVIMGVFGLCTIPAMLALTLAFPMIGENFKQIMFKISLVIILINGIYLAFTGFMAYG